MTDWAHLLAEHGPDLYRTAYRILRSGAEAEDCVQEVMLEVLSRGEAPRVTNMSAYLRWLTASRSLDRLRRRRRRRETGLDGSNNATPSDAGPDEQVALSEKREWLRAALLELPPRRAEVVVLHYFAGMTYEDIAAMTGGTANAVGVALHAARRQLRGMLPAEWIEGTKVRDDHAAL